MLDFHANGDELHFGASLTVRFAQPPDVPHRSGNWTPLLDTAPLPIFGVEKYADRVPNEWRDYRGVFIPVRCEEPLWLDLSARPWRPNVMRIRCGAHSAITGRLWADGLPDGSQDYVVSPDQGWLCLPAIDGDCLELLIHEPRPGRFAARPPRYTDLDNEQFEPRPAKAGIVPDKYGREIWEPTPLGRARVYLANAERLGEILSSPGVEGLSPGASHQRNAPRVSRIRWAHTQAIRH